MIVDGVLEKERTARLVQFSSRGVSPLTLGETIDALAASWTTTGKQSAKMAALQRVSQRAVADRLLTLAADKDASPEVRSIVELKMSELKKRARLSVNVEWYRGRACALDADRRRLRQMARATGIADAESGTSRSTGRSVRNGLVVVLKELISRSVVAR